MRFKKPFFLTFSFFILLWGFTGYSSAPSPEVQKIDAEISELENMKRGYEAKALRHENYAEYLQFEQQAVLETRRHLQLAEENRNKAALVQEQIDRLKAKKEQMKK